ncbi:hypothetical protein GCM10022222_29070 [Amycolatopsis ultiminotia]|uniref:Uncharacterized protein n=1 Tax=Amycolatopsis ultiminotia TaxID=543629 RepID=A0ABP6VYK0_9PSEU
MNSDRNGILFPSTEDSSHLIGTALIGSHLIGTALFAPADVPRCARAVARPDLHRPGPRSRRLARYPIIQEYSTVK